LSYGYAQKLARNTKHGKNSITQNFAYLSVITKEWDKNGGKNIVINDYSILERYALPLVDKLTTFRRVLVTLCSGTSSPRRVLCSEVRELKLKALQSSETSVNICTNIYGVNMPEYLSLRRRRTNEEVKQLYGELDIVTEIKKGRLR
jgi:hypothetical protein